MTWGTGAIKAAEEALVSPRVFGVNSAEGWNTLMHLPDDNNVASTENLVALLKSDS
jgi:hypothetical protein